MAPTRALMAQMRWDALKKCTYQRTNCIECESFLFNIVLQIGHTGFWYALNAAVAVQTYTAAFYRIPFRRLALQTIIILAKKTIPFYMAFL